MLMDLYPDGTRNGQQEWEFHTEYPRRKCLRDKGPLLARFNPSLLDRLEERLITGVIISAERSAKVYIPGHGYFLTADKDREG